MHPGQKKRIFLYAGISFVFIGAISIILTYMFVYRPQSEGNQTFDMEEVHSNPLAMHDHVFLTLLSNGQKISVPQEIGIDPQLWHDHFLDMYGPSGLSPLHTHDDSGVVHIESTVARQYTLGEFFKIAGLNATDVKSITVDGNEIDDLQNHVMKNGEKIQLDFGQSLIAGSH